MADFKGHNEQSMEEILSAIKHIMAEEGGVTTAPAAPVSAPRGAATTPTAHAQSGGRGMAAPVAGERSQPSYAYDPYQHSSSRVAAPPPPPRTPPVQEAILDLTERVDDDGMIGVPSSAPPPNEPPPVASGRLNRPPPLKTPGAMADAPTIDRHMLADATVAASVATLSQVASAGALARQQELPLGNADRTLEEMVRELVRPHLKEWLDAHLPRLVERLVREEINRLVREAQDR